MSAASKHRHLIPLRYKSADTVVVVIRTECLPEKYKVVWEPRMIVFANGSRVGNIWRAVLRAGKRLPVVRKNSIRAIGLSTGDLAKPASARMHATLGTRTPTSGKIGADVGRQQNET